MAIKKKKKREKQKDTRQIITRIFDLPAAAMAGVARFDTKYANDNIFRLS